MSAISNTDKVVTESQLKTDLQNFYGEIRPYLNGAGANEYSTTEHVVGHWIDNKPLYQKTIEISTTTSANTWNNIFSATTINGINNIISAIVLTSTGSTPVFARVSNSNIQLYAPYNIEVAAITIQYTKTTD